MKKIILSVLGIFVPKMSFAMCPICTIAVGSGVGLARYIGIDDVVTGIWVGALLASTSMWIVVWLTKKHWSFKYQTPVIYGLMYGSTLWVLRVKEIMFGLPNLFMGIDKIFFGLLVGTIVFLVPALSYKARKDRGGMALFPFEKVVVPVSSVTIVSIIFYFLTK
jgi:hypothetical protein